MIFKQQYELELWSIQGVRIADISHLARNRKYTLERNEAETLTFDLDLDEFQRFCTVQLRSHPATVLYPYRTDVKVKRKGEYLFGVQVATVDATLDVDAKTLSVKCMGYLNLFADRYVTKSYFDIERTQIARDLITEAQSRTNGNMGVVLQEFPYETGLFSERNYNRANVKQEIQRLTALREGKFDFSFTWDKQFNIYENIGSIRSDLQLTYPGENVVSMTIERNGTAIYNTVTGLGSGFGADQVVSLKENTDSQLTYLMREKIALFNSVVLQDTLDQNTEAVLERTYDILEIPKLTLTGKTFESRALIGVGDRLSVRVADNPYYDNIDGVYRAERIEVSIDDNDYEETIDVYFDNQNVDQTGLDGTDTEISEDG